MEQKVRDMFILLNCWYLIILPVEKANHARIPEEQEDEVPTPKITYTMTIFSLRELSKPQARFVVLPSDLEWPDVRGHIKIKAIDVLFPQQPVVDDGAFEIEFSIPRQVPTPLPLLSDDDYKYLIQNALKLKANPTVKITIKEVAVNGGVSWFHIYKCHDSPLTNIILQIVAGKENIPPPEPMARGGQGTVPKGKKSKVIFLSPNSEQPLFHAFIPQIPRESDILPGNLAKNENISLLRGQWECNLTACRSEHCYVPADGPHFPLSHDHFDKWASAMVCDWL